jgi:hypothetical protein
VIEMGMGDDENVDIKILRLDENGELPIEAICIVVGRICTAVGEVEIDPD